MKQDKTIIHNELRPAYDLKNLQVRKFGPARKQFGKFAKRIIELNSKCQFKEKSQPV